MPPHNTFPVSGVHVGARGRVVVVAVVHMGRAYVRSCFLYSFVETTECSFRDTVAVLNSREDRIVALVTKSERARLGRAKRANRPTPKSCAIERNAVEIDRAWRLNAMTQADDFHSLGDEATWVAISSGDRATLRKKDDKSDGPCDDTRVCVSFTAGGATVEVRVRAIRDTHYYR